MSRQLCVTLALGCSSFLPAAPAWAVEAWPAESLGAATNLTGIEGAGANDFCLDMSGAVWNPVTRTLWVCRNGPGGSNSKFWAVVEDGQGGFQIAYRNGSRGEWTGFGDLEDITQADYNEEVVYLMIEGEDRIKAYDVSVFGVNTLRNDWNIAPYVPAYDGSSGSEGITFVPDSFLSAAGFVDQSGTPYTSHHGMGGLMLVAHQAGGRIYVFDLNRADSTLDFVGAYLTNFSESAALAFDRSSGLLYILHGAGQNRVQVTTLASTVVGAERKLVEVTTYAGPSAGGENMEGIALVSNADCVADKRSFFLTVDGGGANSLFWFKQFPCTDGCIDDDDCSDGNACNGQETCQGGNCQTGTSLNCDDGNACTTDACNTSTGCVHTHNTAACDDGNACTTSDTCANGSCVGGPAPNCNDGNACTTDACNTSTGCVHANVAQGTPCGSASDTSCDNPDTCDGSGVCQNNHEANGTSCSDGVYCNGAETCQGGVCAHGVPVPACCDQNSDCNNNDVCDGVESCVNHTCDLGTPLDCDDSNACTDDSCNSGTGCVNTPDDANSCSDGDACTIDTCHAGVCTSAADASDRDGDGTPDCSDGCPEDPAKTSGGACGCGVAEGSCGGQSPVGGGGGGGAPPLCTTDTECDDDVFCNGLEVCTASGCRAGADPCGDRPCDEAAGACAECISLRECDDGDPCTHDVCLYGKCYWTAENKDGDADGIPDCIDQCPSDPKKSMPGTCGCGVAENRCASGEAATNDNSSDILIAPPPEDLDTLNDSDGGSNVPPADAVEENVDANDNATDVASMVEDGPATARAGSVCGAGVGMMMLSVLTGLLGMRRTTDCRRPARG